MTRFRYRGVDAEGREREGTIDQRSLGEAARELREGGISSRSLERDDWEEISKPIGEIDAFSYFNRSLAALSRVGIPLPRAVREVSRGLGLGLFRKRLAAVEAALKEGKSLDEAVEEAKDVFPRYYRSMVRAGIAAGNLPRILHAIARSHEGLHKARRAVAGALAYPVVSFGLGVILMTGFFTLFVPKIVEFYRVYDLEPSLFAGLLIDTFESPEMPLVGLAAAVLLVILLVAWLRRTRAGESVLFGIPVVGRVLRSLVLARFLGALSILLRAKVGLADAIEVAAGASGSVRLSAERERLRARAEEGERLTDVLGGSKVVSTEVTAYLRLAEEGGRLPDGAEEVAEMHAERSASGSDTIFIVLFPLAILAMGLVMGTMIVSFASSYLDVLEQIPR